MYRAISETEEQAVRLLYNSTADQLGIARPLDPDGWYQVKAYLRSQSADGIPEDWTKDYAWLHSTACSNLAIDPPLPKKGLMRVLDPFLSWILSPADRHGRVGELLRGLVVVLVAGVAGAAALWLARHCGVTSGIWPFVVGDYVGLILLSFVISSDTMLGAQFLLFFLAGVYSLATGNWALSEWLRISVASIGVVFGAFVLSAWLS